MKRGAMWLLLVSALTAMAAVAQTGSGPQDPLGEFAAQERFRNDLRAREAQVRQRIQQQEREILFLENQMSSRSAEAARRERELSAPQPLQDPSTADRQRSARDALERSRMEGEQLQADLERRRQERAQLTQDRERLRQLESQYEADPQRAGELMEELPR